MIRELIIDGVRFIPEPQKPIQKRTFGEQLRDGREFNRWSLDEAAQKTGLSRTYIWELETGAATEPSFRVAITLAAAYNIDLPYLAMLLTA